MSPLRYRLARVFSFCQTINFRYVLTPFALCLCAFVPLCLCAFVPLCLCAFVPLCLCAFVPSPNSSFLIGAPGAFVCFLCILWLVTPPSLCPLCSLWFFSRGI